MSNVYASLPISQDLFLCVSVFVFSLLDLDFAVSSKVSAYEANPEETTNQLLGLKEFHLTRSPDQYGKVSFISVH